uniref:CNNM transmembrane domain-containing protein n=1 Tax=Plectus sambesii TaxID=2011161 RepID=A0A914W285_9BILA
MKKMSTPLSWDTLFSDFSSEGISVVHPDTEVRVVLFGWWLTELTDIAFTTSNNCSDISNIDFSSFDVQVEGRVSVIAEFPHAEENYQICLRTKQKSAGPNAKEVLTPFWMAEGTKTWITTKLPPHKHYFPLPIQIALIVVLLCLSGFLSGNNVGLLALNPTELDIIAKSGTKTERKHALAILPVRRSGNFLLCTQLICNVVVNSAISILFENLTTGLLALIVSSFCIVVLAEIVPQSYCVKNGLAFGAKTIFLTRFFMMLSSPLSWPLGKILDYVVGHEVTVYSRDRLMQMMIMATPAEGGHFADDLKIAMGAMGLSEKKVSNVMTKIDDVFMLQEDTVLNTKTVAEILHRGYTRIPVYEDDRHNVTALLFVKDLALINPDDNFTVRTVCRYHVHQLRFVMEDTPLRIMLEEFKRGDYHLAIAQKIVQPEEGDPYYELTGVVTLEDIVEEILQAEIVDETDTVTDNVIRAQRTKSQAHDLSRFLEEDASVTTDISLQLRLATIQWLSTNQTAFHADMISRPLLERVVRQNVRHVDINNRAKTATLYQKHQMSERFILILEGRVTVTNIGQNDMQFEAGPWHCFGEEVLNKLVEIAPHLSHHSNRFGSASALSSSQDTLDDTNKEIKRHPAAFSPDFTAIALDECTYLEVNVSTYLNAYHASLMQLAVPKSPTITIENPDLQANNLRNTTIEEE